MLALAQTREPAPVRVLIVDDSAVVRAALSRIIASRSGMIAAAALAGAEEAIVWLGEHRADVVLLDINMPGWDGLDALPALIAAARGGRVIIVSAIAAEGAAATVKALALGAADTLAKPAAGGLGYDFGDGLASRILRLGATDKGAVVPRYALRPLTSDPVACLAIGASTGGIHALAELLSSLPRAFDAPILITQHLPAVFMPFFVEQIATLSSRSTALAHEGDRLIRGKIVVAPGDHHLGIIRRGVHVVVTLLDHQSGSRCRPSVDPMFESIGHAFGSGAVGVALTGMGRDGSIGAERLVAARGTVLVQDQATSTVWGMPGSIAMAGLASLIAPPAAIARTLVRLGSA